MLSPIRLSHGWISHASHSFRLCFLHLPAGQFPSPPCPWESYATVSWGTRLHQPTGLATEQPRSHSSGLHDFEHSAGTSLQLLSVTVTSTIWKNDWFKSGVVLIRTLLAEQRISSVIDCINVYARKGTLQTSDLNILTVLNWHQLRWKLKTCG